MADIMSKAKRSQRMSLIRSKGNKNTELRFIILLRNHRISGWRRNQPITGKPDFIFRKQRVAVFVDGCFWHGCDKHCRKPKTRRDFWLPKIAKNVERDNFVNRALKTRGWKVLRVWEHSLENPGRVLRRLQTILAPNWKRK
ncbi:MAG TPA: very short patch repair endonuclease [Verrucomicrobiae bacterium]|nr:very short patch repair endonuclease [Verrucomicrobiae bacterium]